MNVVVPARTVTVPEAAYRLCRPRLRWCLADSAQPNSSGLRGVWAWRCVEHDTGWWTAGHPSGQDIRPVYAMAEDHVREYATPEPPC